jgi:hypothetical protein
MLEILDLSLASAGACAAAAGAQVAMIFAGVDPVFSVSDLADGHEGAPFRNLLFVISI